MKWTDAHSVLSNDNTYELECLKETPVQRNNFVDGNGHLTDTAKELMKEYDAYTLEELFTFIEGKGNGYFYKNDTNRSDVGVKTSDCTKDDVKPMIKPSKMEAEGFLTEPNVYDILNHEPYLRRVAIHSENEHTRREAKIKLHKIDYYRNLGI